MCPHCGARLFEEEESRRKWCCGAGAYKVLTLRPLEESFYNDRRLLVRDCAQNNLYAFCARDVSGKYRYLNGLSFSKLREDVPSSLQFGRSWCTTQDRNDQLVNRYDLYIDYGKERQNIAMGRSVDDEIIDYIAVFLSCKIPYIREFWHLENKLVVKAYLDFQVTSRATYGPVISNRQIIIEVHAVLSIDD